MIRIFILLAVVLAIGAFVMYVALSGRRDPRDKEAVQKLERAEAFINQLQFDAAEHLATEPFARIVHDEIRQYEADSRKQLR